MNQHAIAAWLRHHLSRNTAVGTVVALPFMGLCWYYWSYYPLWDAAIYYECAVDAANTTLNPLAYNCAGHPTMGYLWLPGVLSHFLGASYRIFLVYNAVLAWFMSLAVAGIASRLLMRERRWLDLLLVVGSTMYCPVVVASILQLSPDFGVLVALTLSVHAFLRRWFVRAFLWGILAALSKESGILLFAVEFAAYLVVFLLRAPHSPARKLVAIRRHWPLVLVPIAAVAIIGIGLASRGSVPVWQQLDLGSVFRQFATISFMDNVFPASLATIGVLNGMWIPTLIVFALWASWVLRRVLLALPASHASQPTLEFVVAVFALDLFFLTRFRTFINVRYYLPVFPWILLLAGRGLLSFGLSRLVRLALQGLVLVTQVFCCFRSSDPATVNIFGTMGFGEHRLYRITSLTNECCGLGRDQLVYNLEFAEMDRILRDLLPALLADPEHVIAVHPEADWKLFDSVDPRSHMRDTPRAGSFKVPYTHSHAVAVAATKPERIHYVALPNIANTTELDRYRAWYDVHLPPRRYAHAGYAIDVYELTLKTRR